MLSKLIEFFKGIFCSTEINKIRELENKIKELEEKYNIDCSYYEERIKELENLLLKSIELPDFSYLSGKVIEIDPRNYIKGVNNVDVADWLYYALDYNDWIDVLNKISKTFKAVWKEEVFDCDDFSLLFSAMLAYSVYKSGFNKQFAFGIAWSYTHAYNIFIDKSGKVWIFEPQTNKVIGELGKTTKPYDTVEVWFCG